MKYILLTILLLCVGIYMPVFGQNDNSFLEGEITYMNNQHVYVKFSSTKNINPGDTLMISEGEKGYSPAMTVENKSSMSCVCLKITDVGLDIGENIYYRMPNISSTETKIALSKNEDSNNAITLKQKKSRQKRSVKRNEVRQSIKGRISAASYASFQDFNSSLDPRMKYNLSFKGENLGGSRFGIESYITFRHQINHWNEVTDNFNRAFKIYNLAANYESPHWTIDLGRKVARPISNLGAFDGLHLAYKIKNISFGTILGSRPDVTDYGFNLNLPEAGLYFVHQKPTAHGEIKSTLGIIEQHSGSVTDRRFMYLQHSNSAIAKLYIFASCEIDLYKNYLGTVSNEFSITSLYLSARYRINRKYSLFLAYDNRKNVIYYESYKNYIDKLIEQETRQGFRARFVARPFRFGSIGLSGTYRYQKGNLSPTKNASVYFNYSRLPFIKASTSLSYTYLDTYFLSSHIAGMRLRKDLWKGKLNMGLNYRWVNYIYKNSPASLQNHIVGLDLGLNMGHNLYLALNHEININNSQNYQRSYVKLIKRFR